MCGCDIGAAGNIAIDDLLVRGPGVIVRMSMVVHTTARYRQMMIGAERTVQSKCKRRNDRESGRQALELQMDETDHVSTDSGGLGDVLVAAILSVQTEQCNYT